jgi:Tol biopolymer transport system component
MKRLIIIFLAVILFVGCDDKRNINIVDANDNNIYPNGYLLYIHSEPAFVEGVDYNYLVEINGGEDKTTDIDINCITHDIKNEELVQISLNGKRVLYTSQYYSDASKIYDVYDVILKKVIQNIKITNSNQTNILSFSPLLDRYLSRENNTIYIVDNKNNKTKLNISDKLKTYNIIWSPDSKKIAYIMKQDKENYIITYDVNLQKEISKIHLGEGNALLTQWSIKNNILYNYELNGYMVNPDGKNKKDLGKYIFYPTLSPDGKYLAYSRPGTFQYIDSLFDIEEYSRLKQNGIYIRDMNKNIDTKLPNKYSSEVELDQVPISWISKVNHIDYSEYTSKKNGSLILSYSSAIQASSYLKNNAYEYDAGLAMDGDDGTAWVEGANGNGFGEWLKLSFTEIQDNWDSKEIDRAITGISMINGYSKSSDVYYQNNRIKKIKIEFSDGSSIIRELKDGVLGLQKIDFTKTIITKYVKITVLETYKGKKFNDTCISEIRVFDN